MARSTAVRSAAGAAGLLPAQPARRSRPATAGANGNRVMERAPMDQGSAGLQRALKDDELADRHAADQMFLEDAFEHGWIALPVPHPVGIDHGDRAAAADVEAIGARGVDAPFAHQAQLFEPLRQVLPGADRPLAAAALG